MTTNTVTRDVEWGECDPAGIVFNPNFARWFDHCTTLLYGAAGWPKPKMVKTFNIVGCPLVETNARFRAPARYGDTVTIQSAFIELGTSSFKIRHRVTLGDRLCVEAVDTRVWSVKDPETGRLSSAPIPAEIVEAFGRSNTE